jgi:spore coat polysaccharide biosynthesis protein SpsF
MREPRFGVRRANISDTKDAWLWRNDKESRKNSLETAKIPFSAHKSWFHKNIKKPRYKTFIGIKAKEKIGLIRCHFKSSQVVEFSLMINPEHRGKGFGGKFLKLISQRMAKAFPFKTQSAVIKNSNKASEKIFAASGFIPLHVVDRLGYSLWIRVNRGAR